MKFEPHIVQIMVIIHCKFYANWFTSSYVFALSKFVRFFFCHCYFAGISKLHQMWMQLPSKTLVKIWTQNAKYRTIKTTLTPDLFDQTLWKAGLKLVFHLRVHAGHALQNFSVPYRKRACPVNKVGYHTLHIFSRGHATLHDVLVGPSVRRSVGNISELQAVFALPLLPNRPQLDCRVSGLVFKPLIDSS